MSNTATQPRTFRDVEEALSYCEFVGTFNDVPYFNMSDLLDDVFGEGWFPIEDLYYAN